MKPSPDHRSESTATFARRRGRMGHLFLCVLLLCTAAVFATNSHEYGPNEYVTVAAGISPDRKYAITAHGGSETRDERFHIYLTDFGRGRKIGPLEEIGEILDTGASSYAAQWSKDSQEVTIIYRIDRHEPLRAFTYHIGNGRATLLKGPVEATKAQTVYWGSQCSGDKPSPKVFGTPLNP